MILAETVAWCRLTLRADSETVVAIVTRAVVAVVARAVVAALRPPENSPPAETKVWMSREMLMCWASRSLICVRSASCWTAATCVRFKAGLQLSADGSMVTGFSRSWSAAERRSSMKFVLKFKEIVYEISFKNF